MIFLHDAFVEFFHNIIIGTLEEIRSREEHERFFTTKIEQFFLKNFNCKP